MNNSGVFFEYLSRHSHSWTCECCGQAPGAHSRSDDGPHRCLFGPGFFTLVAFVRSNSKYTEYDCAYCSNSKRLSGPGRGVTPKLCPSCGTMFL